VWFKLVIHFADWHKAALWPGQDWAEPILGATVGIIAQTFFALRYSSDFLFLLTHWGISDLINSFRVYRLSGRRIWLVMGIVFLMLVSWGCSLGVGLQIGLANPYAHDKVC